MGCQRPYEVTLQSAPPQNTTSPYVFLNCSTAQNRWLLISAPCRKCQQCLENRRKLWTQRAKQEILNSHRTWFCTYTISPEWRYRFSLQSGSRRFHDAYPVISKEMTKYFKRLRKAGYKFRYMMVAEAHKNGYPHIHVLCHEVSTPIPKRVLQQHWPYGFTTVKLACPKASHYVAKYLAKDTRARIRASQRYGMDCHTQDAMQSLIGLTRLG